MGDSKITDEKSKKKDKVGYIKLRNSHKANETMNDAKTTNRMRGNDASNKGLESRIHKKNSMAKQKQSR